MEVPPTRDRDTRRAAARIGLLLLGFAVVVAIVLALPGVDDVRERFASTRPGWIAVAAFCYEMLPGGRAFDAPSAADTLGAILLGGPNEAAL